MLKTPFLIIFGLIVIIGGCSQKSTTGSESRPWSANSKYWRDTDTLLQKLNCKDRVFPLKYRLLDANNTELNKLLIREGTTPGSLSPDTIAITIPMPDGTWEPFLISQAQVMSKELAAKYPGIKTYSGKSKLFPTDNIRLDISQNGVRVMVSSTRGTMMIDPYCANDVSHVICYYRKDLPANSKEDFER